MPQATLRYVRVSPTKIRQVLGLIRGLEVDDARETLVFCERAAAQDVLKLLDSAVANAEHNDALPVEELYVERAWADGGPILNRFRPRARGRATRIRKRTSHVTIVVSRFSDDELERRRRVDEAKGGAAPRSRRTTRRRRIRRGAQEHDHEHEEAGTEEAGTEEADTEEPGTQDSATAELEGDETQAPEAVAAAPEIEPDEDEEEES